MNKIQKGDRIMRTQAQTNTPDKVIKYMLQNSEVIKKDIGSSSSKNASDRFLEFVIRRQTST